MTAPGVDHRGLSIVQPRCPCGSQDKVAREVQDGLGVWRPSIQHGNGEHERITCPSCGGRYIRTTGRRPTKADVVSWGQP